MNRRSLLATATLSTLALAGICQDRENDPTSFIWNPALSPTGPVLVWVNLKTQSAAV